MKAKHQCSLLCNFNCATWLTVVHKEEEEEEEDEEDEEEEEAMPLVRFERQRGKQASN